MYSLRSASASLAGLNTQTSMSARVAVVECGVARSRRPEKKAFRQYKVRSFVRARTISKRFGARFVIVAFTVCRNFGAHE